MKNIILFTILSLTIVTCSFFIGKNSNSMSYENKCDFMNEIINWNTNGEELSIVTKDGCEFYAYK